MLVNLNDITAILLAGGQGSRLGNRDKGLILCQGEPLIQRHIRLLTPQVGTFIISANRNIDSYSALGYPVILDNLTDFQGPLAGIAACLAHCQTPYALTLPCDCLGAPSAYVQTMTEALSENHKSSMIAARRAQRLEPLHLFFATRLKDNMNSFLAMGGRKAHDWVTQQNPVYVDFPENTPLFRNINTLSDLSEIDHANK